jgi:hypothetical protein
VGVRALVGRNSRRNSDYSAVFFRRHLEPGTMSQNRRYGRQAQLGKSGLRS